jgi:DNA-directed RNA polymerase specialized sigma24 family protein
VEMQDAEAFGEFVQARAPGLLRYAHLLCGDPDRAALLVEHGLAATGRQWSRFGAERRAQRADAVARQAILTALLSRRRPPTAPTPAAGVGAGTSEVVWRTLAGLPQRRRAVLVLRYAQGLGDNEIATRLRQRPDTVAAEAAAALASVDRVTRGRGRADALVPSALTDPARDDAVAATPVPTAAAVRGRMRRDQRRRLALVGGCVALVAAIVATSALLPGRLGSRPAAAAGQLPATTAPTAAGLLPWPARGPLAGDQDLLRAAAAAWAGAAADPRRPASAVGVLWAGPVDGTPTVLLQALDGEGRGLLAAVARPGGGARLVRADPLSPGVPVVAVPAGARLRFLPAPTSTALYARSATTGPSGPLRRLELRADGLSEAYDPALGGFVAAVGTDDAGTGGGMAGAGQVAVRPAAVDLGVPTLHVAGAGEPGYEWYADAELLAELLHEPIRVSALGPVGKATPRAGPARGHEFRSATYEVAAGGRRMIAMITRRDGRPLCTDVTALATGDPRVPLVAHRCLLGGAGVLQVLAPPRAVLATVTLAPRGRERRSLRVDYHRPRDAPLAAGFVVSRVVTSAYPSGGGRVFARRGDGATIAQHTLPAYRR